MYVWDVYKRQGYGCANYKNDKSGCNFNIGQVAGLDIPEEQVKKLIEEGITDTIRGFKSKSGNRFDACLKLNKDEQTNKVSATFDFENVKPQKDVYKRQLRQSMRMWSLS